MARILSSLQRFYSLGHRSKDAPQDSSFRADNAARTWPHTPVEMISNGMDTGRDSTAQTLQTVHPKLSTATEVNDMNAPEAVEARDSNQETATVPSVPNAPAPHSPPSSSRLTAHPVLDSAIQSTDRSSEVARPPPETVEGRSEMPGDAAIGQHILLARREQRGKREFIKVHRLWFIGGLLLFIIGIIVGFGVGFGRNGNDDKDEPNPPSNNSTAVPHYGIMEGSGIVAIDLNNKSTITAYTQRHDGVIELNLYTDNTWTVGKESENLDTNGSHIGKQNLAARSGTPLMALSYVNGVGELIWHVFYVTVDNYLSDWVNNNATEKQTWYQGTLRSGDFKVSTSPHTGLSACVNERWYGAPFNENGLGIRLYYGNSDDAVQELLWNLGGSPAWREGAVIPDSNGAGGVECTVRGASITYLWMENLNNQLQQMWYDFNLTAGTPEHPVGEWVKGLNQSGILHNSAISAISDFSSIPPTKNVHYQAEDLSIIQLISNGTAENDMWDGSFIVGPTKDQKALNGTKIGSVVLNTGIKSGQEIHVIFQTNSTNMVDFVRGLTDRNWSMKDVPVGGTG